VSAPVRIEARAWNDPRFRTLARLTGLGDPDFAIIKVARIWSWQTERFGEDQDAYVVDRDTVESILGDVGWDALIRSKLADEVPGGLRMRGTEGQIEWCADLTSKRQYAGRLRAAKARRDGTGRMVGNGDDNQPAHAGCAGPANGQQSQQATSTEPPQSSAPTLTPSPEDLSLPRAIPPTTPPPGESAWARRQRWWGAMLEADASLRRAGIEQSAPLLPAAPAGVNEQNMHSCEKQLLESGFDAATVDAKMLHIVAVALAEAMRERSRKYFKPALIWEPARANRAVDTSLEEAARPRAPPPSNGSRKPTEPQRAPTKIL
jgi:hypothetical protein